MLPHYDNSQIRLRKREGQQVGLHGAAAFTNIRAICGTIQTRMLSKLGLVHNF